jgi:hypothetical protein
MSATSNIEASTRELWLRTLEDEIFMALPVLAILEEHKKREVSGKKLRKTVITDTALSLGQSYNANDTLTDGERTVLDYAEWSWAKWQVPVKYTVDEEIENQGADTGTAPIDVVKAIVQQGHEGMRRYFMKMIYGTQLETTTGNKDLLGLKAALTFDATYGGRARATTATNKLWQAASPADSFADQSTAYQITIDNVRQWAIKCRRHRQPNEKLYLILAEANYSKLKAQVGAAARYDGPGKGILKYGFEGFLIDGNIEVICDSTLDLWADIGLPATLTAAAFLLNPNTWSLQISPKRDFKLGPFMHQGQYVNGKDQYLARIWAAGQLMCMQPNANMMLLAVS